MSVQTDLKALEGTLHDLADIQREAMQDTSDTDKRQDTYAFMSSAQQQLDAIDVKVSRACDIIYEAMMHQGQSPGLSEDDAKELLSRLGRLIGVDSDVMQRLDGVPVSTPGADDAMDVENPVTERISPEVIRSFRILCSSYARKRESDTVSQMELNRLKQSIQQMITIHPRIDDHMPAFIRSDFVSG
jgi:hypothetical protein